MHQGCQVPFRISRGNVGFLLRHCSGKGPHLATTGDPRGFSRVAVGFSSYNRDRREPLVLPQGSPISIRVPRGSAALLLGHGRGIWSQDPLKGESQGHSRVATGNPEFPGITRESHHNSTKTTRFPSHRKTRPFPAAASQVKSHVSS